ncbi:SDR family oxidoreductase [Thermoflavifilum thermophilum]|uniref:Short-chain dehydrogenase n=1 Tax=Thermoflavifilum thermophilum TaxID=1393122 RepID=A0A1I7MXF0_9BACT|nr:SDR family oxidoreductase [Thermoflavifilum thermophilum]SFV27091.1 Short-chain dehydrogenase [Thermoflavifilum thermophilum]
MKAKANQQVVAITGGSSGIGRALALHYHALGAKVAVCGRHAQSLQALQGVVGDASRLLTVRADVAHEEDCRRFVEEIIARYGRLDILICNAGLSMRALFADLQNLRPIQQLMQVNFWGAVYCIHYALPYLLQSRGVIAGISSIAGYRGLPGRTGYSASKFALQGFLEALRTELLHSGVHVMWICPGFTASNIRQTALNAKGEQQGETPLDESKLMSAERVATLAEQAIARRKRTLVLTTQGKLTVWVNRLFPTLADRLVYNHFRKEPGSPLK